MSGEIDLLKSIIAGLLFPTIMASIWYLGVPPVYIIAIFFVACFIICFAYLIAARKLLGKTLLT